jgi:hypothetical protein
MVMHSPDSCLVASVVKEYIGGLLGANVQRNEDISVSARKVDPIIGGQTHLFDGAPGIAKRLFGGTYKEWSKLFHDADSTSQFPKVELAFHARLQEALKGR